MQVVHQDIESHEKILDNLSEQSLPLTKEAANQVAHPVKELTSRYTALRHRSKEQLENLNKAVEDHQKYEVIRGNILDTLALLQTSVVVASDESGDLTAVKNRLASVQVGAIENAFISLRFFFSQDYMILI